jgi:hypothetical protein
MYCPNCAASVDGMKFCRQCGANVSLVEQALTGQLPAAQTSPANALPTQQPVAFGHHGRREQRPASIEKAVMHTMIGIGFIFVSFACLFFAPAGRIWWFWLLIPAFANMGIGIGEYLRLQQAQKKSEALPAPTASSFNYVPTIQPPLSAPTTSELQLPAAAVPVAHPVSVVEHTTALLDPARQKTPEKQ